MCLGGGGMMQQPQRPKPVSEQYKAGPPSPDDSVNNQPVPNAQDRGLQEDNRNAGDPKNKNKPKY